MKLIYFLFLALAFTLFISSSSGHLFRNNEDQQAEQVVEDSGEKSSPIWLKSKIVAPLLVGKLN